jgi:hypothetical protein
MTNETEITAEEFRRLLPVGIMLEIERSNGDHAFLEVEESDRQRRLAFRLLNPRRGRIYHQFPRGDGTDIEGTGCRYFRVPGGIEVRSESDSWRYLFVEPEDA